MRCIGRQGTPSPELPTAEEKEQGWRELKDKDGPVTQNDLAKSPTEQQQQQQAPLAKAQSSKTKVKKILVYFMTSWT